MVNITAERQPRPSGDNLREFRQGNQRHADTCYDRRTSAIQTRATIWDRDSTFQTMIILLTDRAGQPLQLRKYIPNRFIVGAPFICVSQSYAMGLFVELHFRLSTKVRFWVRCEIRGASQPLLGAS